MNPTPWSRDYLYESNRDAEAAINSGLLSNMLRRSVVSWANCGGVANKSDIYDGGSPRCGLEKRL